MSGQEALRWRQTSLRAGAAEVKMQFDHLLKSMIPEGVEAHIDQFQGMNDPDVYLVANIKINGKLEGVSATRMTFPLAFLEGHEQQSILDHASRSLPVDMHYAEQDTDELVLHLPAGFALQAVPQDVNIPWEGHAILQIKTTTEPGQVSVTRTLTRGFTLLKPEEYSNLRGFYQKLAVADAHQLVLTRVSTATGN